MTSNSIFPTRLTQVDEITRPDHYYLTAEDSCYFLGEYTARKGYAFSATNSLIINLKKPVTLRGEYQWWYKVQAINQAAAAFRAALNEDALNCITFVPIPPSKARTDPLHDDRMTQVLHAIRPHPPLDVRELIVQRSSTEAVHLDDSRPRPETLEALYEVDESLLEPLPQLIGLVDDVLTTGAHFKAAQSLLHRTFPGVRIIGLFIARRAPEAVDIENIFLGD